MHRINTISNLVTLLLVWCAVCIWTFLSRTETAFLLAYFVLPLSGIFLPLVIGQIGSKLYCSLLTLKAVQPSRQPQLTILFVLFVISYLVCLMVFERMLEIPWRHLKFDDSLSLGRSVIFVFVIIVFTLSTAIVFLLRGIPRNTKAAHFGASALAMLIAACCIYFMVGLSPLVVWRN